MWNLTDVRLFLVTVHYENPHLIRWAIPAAVFTAVLFFVWWRSRVKAIKQHGDLRLVTRFTSLPNLALGCFVAFGLVSAVVLGFCSATMPYQTTAAMSVPAGSLHIVSIHDTSKSLGAEDLRPDQQRFGGPSCGLTEGPCGNRIAIGKLILINQIMPAVKENVMGLVVYSGNAVTHSPLTDDFQSLRDMLTTWHWVDVGSGLGEGSYVDQGLLAGVDVLNQGKPKDGKSVQNIILLFTDGGNDSSKEDMEKAETAVKEANAKLIIIGLGSDKETAIPLYDGSGKPKYNDRGQRAYFELEEGQKTARDDQAMEQLAADVGGQYLKVVPGQPLTINWPNALGGSRVVVAKHYLYQYPLAGCVALIALIWLGALWSRLLSLVTSGLRLPFGRRS
jgi:hypothetical protein